LVDVVWHFFVSEDLFQPVFAETDRRKPFGKILLLKGNDRPLMSRPRDYVKTAGLAIVKQRPGTASGVVFLSVSDETGVFNVFVAPDFSRETA
jgi:DNA polymerase III alpha subunit